MLNHKNGVLGILTHDLLGIIYVLKFCGKSFGSCRVGGTAELLLNSKKNKSKNGLQIIANNMLVESKSIY